MLGKGSFVADAKNSNSRTVVNDRQDDRAAEMSPDEMDRTFLEQ